jgi:hypothetical protein
MLFIPVTLLLESLNNKILLYDEESLNLNALSVESYKTLPVIELCEFIWVSEYCLITTIYN